MTTNYPTHSSRIVKKVTFHKTLVEHARRRSSDLREIEWIVVPDHVKCIQHLIEYLQKEFRIETNVSLYFANAFLQPNMNIQVLRELNCQVCVIPAVEHDDLSQKVDWKESWLTNETTSKVTPLGDLTFKVQVVSDSPKHQESLTTEVPMEEENQCTSTPKTGFNKRFKILDYTEISK